MAETVIIKNITLTGVEENYSSKDENLLSPLFINRSFGLSSDYVEYHIYTSDSDLLVSNIDYKGYKLSRVSSDSLVKELKLDPEKNIREEGFDRGNIIITYNILRNLLNSNKDNQFWIKDISSSRKELRLISNNLSPEQLKQLFDEYSLNVSSTNFYKDFYLNFGDNNLLLGVNLAYDNNSILVKLYEPLPNVIEEKSTLWLCEKLADSISYDINILIDDIISIENKPFLRGPNFDVSLNDSPNSSTDYYSYDNLFSNDEQTSYQQLKSLLDEKSIDINVDYSEYSNFVHFSSIKERLSNFVYKLKLIEDYQNDISIITNISSSSNYNISSSISTLQNNIDNIIKKFDNYEYYLYFESGSKTWPKTNSTKPYALYNTTSSVALTWLGSNIPNTIYYGGELYSASLYDQNNQDNVYYTIPEYLRVDNSNRPYEIFLYMIGQHFDNLWIYIKSITDLYQTNNNLTKGVSKDLVAYSLKSLGVKLYNNNFSQNDLFSYWLGITPSGSLLPSTGSEYISTYITASNSSIPGNDISKEIYKRIYHNLPYLLKSKGTKRGLKALIACYGIPDTILNIQEFGGGDKSSGSFENYYDRFEYSLLTDGQGIVEIPWLPTYQQYLTGNSGSVADSIEFRFKTAGVPFSSSYFTQSLFQVGYDNKTQFGVQLLYNTLINTGSRRDLGELRLIMSGSQGFIKTSPITLPFFDEGWWSVLVKRSTGSYDIYSTGSNNIYKIYAKNNIYNGDDGNTIGFQGSSSLFITGSTSSSYNFSWNNYYDGFTTSSIKIYNAYLGGTGSNNVIAPNGIIFTGSFMEFRYWSTPLNENIFDYHVLNPLSYEGNNLSSSYNNLSFRLPLGNDLKTYNLFGTTILMSNHTSYPYSASFYYQTNGINSLYGSGLYGVAVYGGGSGSVSGSLSSAIAVNFPNKINFNTNVETYYTNYGNIGSFKPITDKIRLSNQNIISSSVLSPYVRIENEQIVPLTQDLHFVDVSFSPQNEINKDIINELGYFNIDEYIGDPREKSSTKYSDLETLKNIYYKKKINRYNLFDYIRLIKYFDNSLFKMIKDYVPARTNVLTGLNIQPTLFERSKQKQVSTGVIRIDYTSSIEIGSIEGDSGGIYEGNISNYLKNEKSFSGSLIVRHNDNKEFYNGELNGSQLIVTSQSLSNNIYKNFIPGIDLNKFYVSDFNVLVNNAEDNIKTKNNKFDADYSSNALVPVNFDLIFSGSAIRSGVPDSNYTIKRHINPRYLGSKLNSLYYNNYTSASATYGGDISYGKNAVIDSYINYFAYFDWWGASNPEFPNGANAHIVYLVDAENKEIITLSPENKNIGLVEQMFKIGTYTSIIDMGSSQTYKNYMFKIIKGGGVLNTILNSTPNLDNYDFVFNGDSTSYTINNSFYFRSSSLSQYLIESPSSTSNMHTVLFYNFNTSKILEGTSFETQFTASNDDQRIQTTSGSLTYFNDTSFIDISLLPIKKGDIIRWWSGSKSNPPEKDNFNISNVFYQGTITNISQSGTAWDSTFTSSFTMDSSFNNSFLSNASTRHEWNLRLLRYVPQETYVLLDKGSLPENLRLNGGLLIPENFNPRLKNKILNIANEVLEGLI